MEQKGVAGEYMFACRRRALKRQERGFTLIELIVVLAILGIILALAIPRYIIPRKKAYKVEAQNILQELKTMEWAYFQQYGSFTNDVTSAGLVMPSGSHWAMPQLYTFTPDFIVFGTYGVVAPMALSDIVYVTLSSDGSASYAATF